MFIINNFINIASLLCGEDISAEFKQHLYSSERIELSQDLANYGVELQKQKFKKDFLRGAIADKESITPMRSQ